MITRILQEKCQKGRYSKLTKFLYSEYFLEYLSLHNFIKNEVPKAENITALGCNFEVTLPQPDDTRFKKRGNRFWVKRTIDVIFDISKVFVPNCNSLLFIRAMIVDPLYRECPIKCRNGHGNNGPNSNHILRSITENSSYEGDANGFYPDNRLSIKTLRQPAILYRFMCDTKCFLVNGTYALLVFILEDEYGNMYARTYFKFKVRDRPVNLTF